MTTIVYRARVLASDTRVTADESCILPELYRKIYQLKDGGLFGAAGDVEECALILRALRNNHASPKTADESTEAIHVRADGSVWAFQGLAWMRVRAPFVAIGTGAWFALGALAMGATAVEAVRVGMRFDAYSGGRVHRLFLNRGKHA